MSEKPVEEASGIIRKSLEIHSGESFTFGSQHGARSVIIGRNPLSENLALPSDFPEDALTVKLLNTSKLDTSRQQVRIEKGLDGRFFVENMSKTIAMKVNAVSLQPQGRILLTGRTQDMQRLTLMWRGKYGAHILRANGFSEISEGKWSLGLRFD